MIHFKAWGQNTEGFKKGIRTPVPTGILEMSTDILNTPGPRIMVGRDKVKWEGGRGMGGVTSTRHSHGLPAPLRMSRVGFSQLWLLPLTLWVALAASLISQASVLPPGSTQITVNPERLMGRLESWCCRGRAEPWVGTSSLIHHFAILT